MIKNKREPSYSSGHLGQKRRVPLVVVGDADVQRGKPRCTLCCKKIGQEDDHSAAIIRLELHFCHCVARSMASLFRQTNQGMIPKAPTTTAKSNSNDMNTISKHVVHTYYSYR